MRKGLIRTAVGAGAAAAVMTASSTEVAAHGFDGDDTWADNHQISQGSTGDNVAFWQQMTQSISGPCSSHYITGNFGSLTRDYTMWFQGGHGLTADGIVGPNTWTSAKAHLEYQSQSSGITYMTFGYGWGHYQPGEPHYAGVGYNVAKNSSPTNAWKRYNGWNGQWYGTDHPTVTGPSQQPFCD